MQLDKQAVDALVEQINTQVKTVIQKHIDTQLKALVQESIAELKEELKAELKENKEEVKEELKKEKEELKKEIENTRVSAYKEHNILAKALYEMSEIVNSINGFIKSDNFLKNLSSENLIVIQESLESVKESIKNSGVLDNSKEISEKIDKLSESLEEKYKVLDRSIDAVDINAESRYKDLGEGLSIQTNTLIDLIGAVQNNILQKISEDGRYYTGLTHQLINEKTDEIKKNAWRPTNSY